MKKAQSSKLKGERGKGKKAQSSKVKGERGRAEDRGRRAGWEWVDFEGVSEAYLSIPMNPDTDSNNLRTPIPIQTGHLFQSKADTPQIGATRRWKLVNVRRYFSILQSI